MIEDKVDKDELTRAIEDLTKTCVRQQPGGQAGRQ